MPRAGAPDGRRTYAMLIRAYAVRVRSQSAWRAALLTLPHFSMVVVVVVELPVLSVQMVLTALSAAERVV
jgi:hypothetical protein